MPASPAEIELSRERQEKAAAGFKRYGAAWQLTIYDFRLTNGFIGFRYCVSIVNRQSSIVNI